MLEVVAIELVEVNIPFNQDFTNSSPERRERSKVHKNLENNAWHTENLVESWLYVDSFSMKLPLGSACAACIDVASNGFNRNCHNTLNSHKTRESAKW